MAEAEVSVDSESIICEKKGDSPMSEEAGQEAPERLEEVTPAASIEPSASDSLDQKRKIADLEPFENDEAPAKKQQIDVTDCIAENPASTEDDVTVALEIVKQEIEGEETGGSAGMYAVVVAFSILAPDS